MSNLDIRKIRLESSLSQKDFAKKIGVHWRTIQNWEKNGGVPESEYTKACALLKHKYTQDKAQIQLTHQKYFGGESSSSNQVESVTIVPLIPISAQGGSLNDFTASVMEYDCEKVLSPIRDVDFAMTVSGDSMSPEYPSGCQVLVKRINERAFIDWGKVYVLDTINGTIIKKLMPVEGNPEKVKCVSINPEYPSFEVGFEHIRGVYRVLMCMSLK